VQAQGAEGAGGSASGGSAASSASSTAGLGAISIEALPRPLGGKFGSTALWHFMAHLPQRQQLVRAAFGEPFASSSGRQQLCAAYAQLHACVWDCPEGTRPNKLVWLATERMTLLALADAEMELYVVCDPLTDQGSALRLAETLKKYLHIGARMPSHTQPGTTQLLLLPH